MNQNGLMENTRRLWEFTFSPALVTVRISKTRPLGAGGGGQLQLLNPKLTPSLTAAALLQTLRLQRCFTLR